MGEAWFMSKQRRMFDGLMASDAAAWPVDELQTALTELGSGPVCFGHMREWREWFPYLLHTAHVHVGPWSPGSVYAGMVTAMMVHCPSRAESRYGTQFVDDVLATWGQLPMEPRFWRDGRMVARSAFSPVARWPVGLRIAEHGDLHAACWLMAKYLSPERLSDWLASAMAIEDPIWGCGFLSWMAHAEPVFDDPRTWLAAREGAGGGWWGTESLKGEVPEGEDGPAEQWGPFLEPWRVQALLSALAEALDAQRIDAWRSGLSDIFPEPEDRHEVVWQFDSLRDAVLRRHSRR